MIELVKTEPCHLYSLHNRAKLLEDKILIKLDNFMKVCDIGTCVTVMEDGLPIAAAGVVPQWKGVGELWALLSENTRDRPIKLCKVTAKIIEIIQQEGNYHRLQAIVLKDFTSSIRWMKHLGFQCEGLLRQYGVDKRDFYRFARIY